MKFAHFSHVWNKPRMTAAERYEQLWRELAACDEIGFDSCFAVEHHFNPNESWMPYALDQTVRQRSDTGAGRLRAVLISAQKSLKILSSLYRHARERGDPHVF